MFKKKLIIFSLIMMILIISFGFVSAGENTTQTSVIENDLQSSEYSIQQPCLNETGNNGKVAGYDSAEIEEQVTEKPKETHKADIELYISDEIIPNNPVYAHFNNPNNFGGNIDIYIDNQYYDTLKISEHYSSGWEMVDSSDNLTLGNHVCNLVYNGSDYYTPFNKTFEFEITNVIIELYEKMYDNNYIRVLLSSDATGTVTININGSVKQYNAEDSPIKYPISDLSYDKYNIEVTYNGNYGTKTRKENVTVDYNMELYENNNEIDIYFDYYNYGNMTVLIDGKDIKYDKYNVHIPEDEPSFLYLPAPIYLSDYPLSKGIHTVELIYSGDDIRPAKSIKETFYITDSIFELDNNDKYMLNDNVTGNFTTYYKLFLDTTYPINFLFAENTTGNFSIYLSSDGENYTLFDSTDIINDTAKINVSFSREGKNYMKVKYNTNRGNDEFDRLYDIVLLNISGDCDAYPNWSGKRYHNSDPFHDHDIIFEYSDNITGNISIYITRPDNTKEFYTQREFYEGGKLRIYIPCIDYKQQSGKYIIEAFWDSNYGSGNATCFEIDVPENAFNYELYFMRCSNKNIGKNDDVIIFYRDDLTYSIGVATMMIFDIDPVVTFKIGKEIFNVKTDHYDYIATFKIPKTLKPGTYTLEASYQNAKFSKKIIIKHILSLKTVNVKKTAKKLTLQATLKNTKAIKGKTVTFKFNGKTYKTKTNAKGIAKVTVPKSVLKKLKVGKKITYQATYLKDTVKKTVKVQK